MADQYYTRPDLLAEPDWLWDHRHDPGVRLIDCGTADAYRRAHIPGALELPVHPWIKGGGLNNSGIGRRLSSPRSNPTWTTSDGDEVRHVMGPDEFADVMGRLGVSDDTTVVAYDDVDNLSATRLWWVLSYYGHAEAKVLNGGWYRWLSEGRPVSLGPATPKPGRFTPPGPMRT